MEEHPERQEPTTTPSTGKTDPPAPSPSPSGSPPHASQHPPRVSIDPAETLREVAGEAGHEGAGGPSAGGGEEQKTTVTPSDVSRATGIRPGEVKEPLTSTQVAGLWLAGGVGFLIIVATVIVLVGWSSTVHSLPATFPTDPTVTAETLQDYKAASDIGVDRSSKLFDEVVVRALLPVFTTILGYIFGTQAVRRSTN